MLSSCLLALVLAGSPVAGDASPDLVEGLHLTASLDGGRRTLALDRLRLDDRLDAGAVYRIGYGARVKGIPLAWSASTWNRWVATAGSPRLQYADVEARISTPFAGQRGGWRAEATPTLGFSVPTSVDFSPWTVLHAGGQAGIERGRVRAALLGSVEWEISRFLAGSRPRPFAPEGRVSLCRPEELNCGANVPANRRANAMLVGEARVWGPVSLAATTRFAYDGETLLSSGPAPRPHFPRRAAQRFWDSALMANFDLGQYAALTLGAGSTVSLDSPPPPGPIPRTLRPTGYDPYPNTWRGFVTLLLRTDGALSPLWMLP